MQLIFSDVANMPILEPIASQFRSVERIYLMGGMFDETPDCDGDNVIVTVSLR